MSLDDQVRAHLARRKTALEFRDAVNDYVAKAKPLTPLTIKQLRRADKLFSQMFDLLDAKKNGSHQQVRAGVSGATIRIPPEVVAAAIDADIEAARLELAALGIEYAETRDDPLVP
jgi:hypothetical protein